MTRTDPGLSMSADAAFLAPILARPHDDGPRLIYADYLDESDRPIDRAKADLIRTQCALARLVPGHPRALELSARQANLILAYQAAWTAPLDDLAVGFEFRRGLLEGVFVEARTFVARGDELFRFAPVRRVRVIDAAEHVEELAWCPHLARVRELDLCGRDLGPGGLNALLRSPYLGGVRELDLSFNALTDAAAANLARCVGLARLQRLSLSGNASLGCTGAKAVAAAGWFAKLTALDISENRVRAGGMRSLVEAAAAGRLQSLKAFANPLTDAAVTHLAGSPLWPRLVGRSGTVNLRHCDLGPDAAEALGAADGSRGVTALNLSGNHLGDGGIVALVTGPRWHGLKRLHVARNGVGDAGARSLGYSTLMRHLRLLDVSGNRITQAGVDVLWRHRRDFRVQLDTGGNFASDRTPEAGATLPESIESVIGGVLGRYRR